MFLANLPFTELICIISGDASGVPMLPYKWHFFMKVDVKCVDEHVKAEISHVIVNSYTCLQTLS